MISSIYVWNIWKDRSGNSKPKGHLQNNLILLYAHLYSNMQDEQLRLAATQQKFIDTIHTTKKKYLTS